MTCCRRVVSSDIRGILLPQLLLWPNRSIRQPRIEEVGNMDTRDQHTRRLLSIEALLHVV